MNIFRLRRLFDMEPLIPDHSFKCEYLYNGDDSPIEGGGCMNSIDDMSSVHTGDDEF